MPSVAHESNHNGQMVGNTYVNGQSCGLLIDPIDIPEPGTLSAALLGIALFAMLRYKIL